MKLSVLAVALADRPLPQALQFLKERGAQAVEIGCGQDVLRFAKEEIALVRLRVEF